MLCPERVMASCSEGYFLHNPVITYKFCGSHYLLRGRYLHLSWTIKVYMDLMSYSL